MYIDPTSKLFGLPALKVRDTLYTLQGTMFTQAYLAHVLGKNVPPMMRKKGLVEEHEDFGTLYSLPHEDYRRVKKYQLTLEGVTIAMASGRQYSQKAAEKALDGFVQRVGAINADEDHPYKVSAVVVFGSVLGQAPKVSDVDLALAVVRRDSEIPVWQQKCALFALDAEIPPQLDWMYARQCVYRYLKHGSPILSLGELDKGYYNDFLRSRPHKWLVGSPETL